MTTDAGARHPLYAGADLEPRREHLYRAWERYLMARARSAYERRGRFWRWDFSSLDAYERSIIPARRRWRATLGGWPARRTPLSPRYDLLAEAGGTGGRYRLERVWFTVVPGVEVDALLLTPLAPGRGPRAAVIAQHGVNGTPEEAVGLVPEPTASQYYCRLGIRLAERGYVVLAPHLAGGWGGQEFGEAYIPRLTGKPQGRARTQLYRLAIEHGRTLMGVETFMLSRAVDLLSAHAAVDPQRVGMYGLSKGGQATLWFAALDTRIAAAVVSGYFNERFGKMLVPSEQYVSYIETDLEFTYLMGRLRAFGDPELASLICPRPLFVEHGEQDSIGWWEHVRDEFARVEDHYRRLGIADRVGLDIHEHGHIVHGEQAFPFLDRWLEPWR